jgi:hypothetical protein
VQTGKAGTTVARLRVASIACRYSEERVVFQERTVLRTGPKPNRPKHELLKGVATVDTLSIAGVRMR